MIEEFQALSRGGFRRCDVDKSYRGHYVHPARSGFISTAKNGGFTVFSAVGYNFGLVINLLKVI